jgi:hypothetical protein
MSDKPKTDTEKYAGPGKITSAIGGWILWGIPGSVVTALSGLPLRNTIETSGMAESLPKTKGFALGITGLVVGFGLAAYGAIRGWGKARKGEEQFNELKSQRNELNARNQAMETQVQGLNEEVGMNRKRFTETISSRSAHGSHKDAAHHDKKHSATAEVGA